MPETWRALERECAQCRECALCQTRHSVVFGTGNPQAEVLLVGEAPGANEDEQGIPFVGRAGKFLDDMLAIIGLDRTKVYITNIVKCRPPKNRDRRPHHPLVGGPGGLVRHGQRPADRPDPPEDFGLPGPRGRKAAHGPQIPHHQGARPVAGRRWDARDGHLPPLRPPAGPPQAPGDL